MKMIVTDQIKILDDKIKSNKAQYDLGREAAKIPLLSFQDLLEKYEYLTSEDLGDKASVFEKSKFEYSPLGMSLSKAFRLKVLRLDVQSVKLKVLLRVRVIPIMIATTIFADFTKGMMNLNRCH